MADTAWIENINKIVLQAMEAGNPSDVVLGTVIKAAPLEIQIGPKTALDARQLLIPRALTDYRQEMEIPGLGTVVATIRNSLKAGEKVLLVQKRGGQQFLVVGRWQEGG